MTTVVRDNPAATGVRRGDRLYAWVCSVCGRPVRQPGYLGRSWCSHCEDYPYTIEVSR